jgi:hypothetical protein
MTVYLAAIGRGEGLPAFVPQTLPAVRPPCPQPAPRHRRLEGAQYFGYPVYEDTLADRLYYETDSGFFIRIARTEEGRIRFDGGEEEEEETSELIDALITRRYVRR